MKIVIQQDTKCTDCGKVIPKGRECNWEYLDPIKGIYHIECIPEGKVSDLARGILRPAGRAA